MDNTKTKANSAAIFEAARAAGYDPIPLHRWDAVVNGRKVGKAPRDLGWTTKDYEGFDATGI